MGLKFVVQSLSEITNEAHKALYKPQDDGTFRLDVDGVVPREKLDEFRNNNVALQNEKTTLSQQLDKFKDIDPAKYQEFKSKAEAYKGDKDIEDIVNQRLTEAKKNYTDQIENLSSKLNSSESTLAKHLIGSSIREAAVKVGAVPTALKDIEGRANELFTVENGKVIPKLDGAIVYGKDGVTPMSASEWAVNLSKEAPHLFSQNQGGGANNSGARSGDKSRENMSIAEKIAAGLDA